MWTAGFSSLIAAEGRFARRNDVHPRETSFSADERGETSAVRRLEFTKRPRRSKPDGSQSSFSVNLPWMACGFVCNVSISPSFPAPTSSTDLNSNNKENYRMTPMIESLRTTQIAFFRFVTPSGFLVWGGEGGGRRRGTKVFVQGSVQGKILWNHLWEHRFSVPDPRVVPPPGGRFSVQKTENRIYDWAARVAQ